MTRSIRPGRRLPYFFLDVDGVVNAFAYEPSVLGFGDFECHEVAVDDGPGTPTRYFEVWLSRTMGARISMLHADIRWLTTWQGHADIEIAPRCGLPRGLPVVESEGRGRTGLDWKFEAVRRTVETDLRPFVWVDDDLDLFVQAGVTPQAWADSLKVKSLLIGPDPRTGLMPGDLETIEVFIADVS